MDIGPKQPKSESGAPSDSGAVINKPPAGTSGGVFGRSSEGGGGASGGGTSGSGKRPGCPLPILALVALAGLLLAWRRL
jgi:hypothetical protein